MPEPTRRAFLTAAIASALGCTPRTHEQAPVVVPKDAAQEPDSGATEVDLGEPVRDRASYAEVYLPPKLTLRDGKYDLLVHFHGIPKLQEEATARARLSCVVASVNVGLVAGPYGNTFRQRAVFSDMLDKIDAAVKKREKLAKASRGRLALSGWSSGAGAVAVLLANGFAEDTDAVLLADGLFAAYIDPKKKTVHRKPLEPVAAYVERAKKRETLFVLTHTSIPTDGFPGMPETVGTLLEMTGLQKKPPESEVGPCSSKVIYEVHVGDAHVTGYDGMLAGDHVSQIKHMDESEFSYLRTRWEKRD